MKKILFVTLTAIALVLSTSGIANAAWKEIGSNEQMTVYVDTDTVQSKGEKAQIFSMLDFKKPGANPQNKKVVNSIVGLNEFDCPNVSYRPIAFREFTEQKGAGEIVSDNNTPDSKFEPVQSNTWAAGVFNTVCKIK
jgi:cell division protein FtsX